MVQVRHVTQTSAIGVPGARFALALARRPRKSWKTPESGWSVSDPIGFSLLSCDPTGHSARWCFGFTACAFALLVSTACSSDDSHDASSSALAAPELTSITPMTGALHLKWTTHQHDCDSFEGERKTSALAFAAAFSVPGSVDNEMDATATDPAETYTYRLRCKKGSTFSPYSNEMSGSP